MEARYEQLTSSRSWKVVLHKGTEEELRCYSYRENRCKSFFFHLFSIFLLGIPYLCIYWRADWGMKLMKSRCPMDQADFLILKDCHGQKFTVEVKNQPVDRTFPFHLISESLSQTHTWATSPTPSTHLMEALVLNLKYFTFHHVKYIWDPVEFTWVTLCGLDEQVEVSKVLEQFHGYTIEEQQQRLLLYGENEIQVEVKSYWTLLVTEVLNPFYIFQIGSIILWSLDNYLLYAVCIFLISVVSIGVSLYETRKQSETLHQMVASSAVSHATVMRSSSSQFTNKDHFACIYFLIWLYCEYWLNGSGMEEVNVQMLVPGDVIVIPRNGCIMPCDAALIQGSCIVNESMLTGESVPVTKTQLTHTEDEEIYSSEIQKRHTLFAGTRVIQTRFYGQNKVLGVVVRTGFSTAKGELIRSILFPKPMGFRFYKDSIKFILAMFFIALCGMVYCIYIYVEQGAQVQRIIIRTLDIITIAVPPALPAAMTVGTVYAQNRLQKQGVFCTSPPRINVCGKLQLFCFDKSQLYFQTGTLTEEGLDMWGVVPISSGPIEIEPLLTNVALLPESNPLLIALATCHSLTMVDNQLTGDPLDVKMFNATKWILFVWSHLRKRVCFQVLEEPGEDEESRFDLLLPTVVRPPIVPQIGFDPNLASGNGGDGLEETEFAIPYEVGIVRQFPFTSSLQRMSVITRTLGKDHMDFFCKGAPEKIASLCHPQSRGFWERVREYTVQGFRVLAFAWKPLGKKFSWHQAQRIKRETLEHELSLLGLLIMRNTLKPQTTPVIQELYAANIHSVMVTGDDILTAVSVAHECKMIKPNSQVIVVSCSPSEEFTSPWILFEEAEMPQADIETAMNAAIASTTYSSVDETLVCLGSEEKESVLALTGKTWAGLRTHFPFLVPFVTLKGRVFARMAPDHKAQLVESFQALDYVVGMCGDGANDCGVRNLSHVFFDENPSKMENHYIYLLHTIRIKFWFWALKTAHVGISLSDAEASVAAPFTSRITDITCVPRVIREGRCSLMTSFGTFKYMALYSMVQFISVLILYTVRLFSLYLLTLVKSIQCLLILSWDLAQRRTNLGDMQFLYIDLVITTSVAVLMGLTPAYPVLVKRTPPGSLLSPSILLSIILQILLACGIQIAALYLLLFQPWFHGDPNHDELVDPIGRGGGDQEIVKSWENSVIFSVSSFQYLILAAAVSKGPPFRKPFYANYLFLVALLGLGLFNALLLVLPLAPLASFFELMPHHQPIAWFFRLLLLGLIFLNIFFSFIIEWILDLHCLKRLLKAKKKGQRESKGYKELSYQLNKFLPDWPPIGVKLFVEDIPEYLCNMDPPVI
ncbi:unnamed protein product, partial [Darwinula stevensoni]